MRNAMARASDSQLREPCIAVLNLGQDHLVSRCSPVYSVVKLCTMVDIGVWLVFM